MLIRSLNNPFSNIYTFKFARCCGDFENKWKHDQQINRISFVSLKKFHVSVSTTASKKKKKGEWKNKREEREGQREKALVQRNWPVPNVQGGKENFVLRFDGDTCEEAAAKLTLILNSFVIATDKLFFPPCTFRCIILYCIIIFTFISWYNYIYTCN